MNGSASLAGKLCVITGGTSGIGEATASLLARRGADVVIVGRDAGRNDAACRRISEARPAGSVRAIAADLSLQAEVRRLAEAILQSSPRVHVLVNNAGAMFSERKTTVEGIERTFALNVLAPFLLTEQLGERLKQSRPSRVVNVSSDAHRRGHVAFDDLQFANSFSPYRAYCTTKLELLLLTKAFARRFDGSGVVVNAANPGRVDTAFGQGNQGLMPLILRTVQRVLGVPPAQAARTVLYVASAPDLADRSGLYASRERLADSSEESNDVPSAERLWTACAGLTGVSGSA